jgi:hypothetical protein
MHEVCAASNAAHNAPGLSECYGLSLPASSFGDDFAALHLRFVFMGLASLSLGNPAEREVTPDSFAALVMQRNADSETSTTRALK